MQSGLVDTHDLFISIVSALMLLIYILVLKGIDPVCKYKVVGLCWKSGVSVEPLVCSNVCEGVLLHLTHI